MKKNDQAPKGKKENRVEKVIVFMLVVLISLLSFSVGVISGKGLSDKQFALESLDKKHSHALTGEEFKDEATADLSEEEIQQLADAAVQAAQSDSEELAAGAIAVTADTVAAKAAPQEDNRTPTSVKKPAAKPAPTAAAATAPTLADYTVQVASYPSLNDAESMSTSLVKKGFPAFPVKVNIKGQDWYRVSVGNFKTKKEASDYQDTLKKQGVVKDAVVQKLIK